MNIYDKMNYYSIDDLHHDVGDIDSISSVLPEA